VQELWNLPLKSFIAVEHLSVCLQRLSNST